MAKVKVNPEVAASRGSRIGRALGFGVVNIAASLVSVVGGVAVGLAQGTGQVAKEAWDATEESRANFKARLDAMAEEGDPPPPAPAPAPVKLATKNGRRQVATVIEGEIVTTQP